MTRIMIFGTFDMVHEGHVDMFKQARALGKRPHLIVSVARDAIVERIKGARPRKNEEQRAALLRRNIYVDEVVLGQVDGYIEHVLAAKPDIIALGYDQEGEYVEHLQRDLGEARERIKIVRLKSHEPHIFKTSKFRS
jgi:cytidyltransferase-like protein